MKIVDCENYGKSPVEEWIYTVELAAFRCVDIKLILPSGLIYIMQNHDGTEVYDPRNRDATYPGYRFNKDEVIDLVLNDKKRAAAHREDSFGMQPLRREC